MAGVQDDTAYVDFVTGRWAGLFRLSYLLTGSEHEAEDLLQSVLTKAYASWRRIERLEAPEAYVRRMLVNGAISAGRRGWRRREVPRSDLPETTMPPVHAHTEDRADLWPVVKRLPPKQRAVVVLRYYEDLSEAEIAHVLGCAPGTVKSQASDALRSLRRLVPAEGGR